MSGKRSSYLQVTDEAQNVVEHFEQVQNRIEDLIKHAKSLIVVLKKRVQVDKEHVKAVQKLSQTLHEDSQLRQLTFAGSLDGQWSSVKEHIRDEAMHVSRVATTLEQSALQPLQVFLLADLEKRFRGVVNDGRRVIKEHTATRAALQRARDKYHLSAAEWEGTMLALYREQGDSWNPAPGNKLYEKEAALTRRRDEARLEYEGAVGEMNAVQNECFTGQLPRIIDSLTNVAENMAAVVHNALKSFSEMQRLLVKGEGSKSGLPLDRFDAALYCRSEILASVVTSDIPPPSEYYFEEFPFQDQTLMIQTRKVQYQCMSKLSASELASRAHQFLANGDKRRSSGTASKPSRGAGPGVKGINHTLVSVCLQYLSQPRALKEEGLFRVSGDSAVIRSLYSEFMSGRASKEFLLGAVMEQMDPNNISGLLKLHLRENPFLSADSLSAVEQILSTSDKAEVVPAVVSALRSDELSLVTDIASLLARLVEDKWRSSNKMAAHTLGIACGLSLFPQLEPAKATLLTERLISQQPLLLQSHTVL